MNGALRNRKGGAMGNTPAEVAGDSFHTAFQKAEPDVRIFMRNQIRRKEQCFMDKTKDVVCGAEIDRDRAAGSFDYQGKTYHFCSEQCRDVFKGDPASFIK
jgi:YHS domain-containing protein